MSTVQEMYVGNCKSLWRKNMGKLPTHQVFLALEGSTSSLKGP